MGLNDEGQCGIGKNPKKQLEPKTLMQDNEITGIYCGSKFSFIVKSKNKKSFLVFFFFFTNFFKKTENSLIGFGSNKWGQLMVDNMENIYSPKIVREEIRISSMACGEGHTLILTR